MTSTGGPKGADYGGIEGADRHCQTLATKAGAGAKTWRAYMATQVSGSYPYLVGAASFWPPQLAASSHGDAPVLSEIANNPSSSRDRAPRLTTLLAVSPAAATYRASGLVLCARASSRRPSTAAPRCSR
jgi:hypothetical protein